MDQVDHEDYIDHADNDDYEDDDKQGVSTAGEATAS